MTTSGASAPRSGVVSGQAGPEAVDPPPVGSRDGKDWKPYEPRSIPTRRWLTHQATRVVSASYLIQYHDGLKFLFHPNKYQCWTLGAQILWRISSLFDFASSVSWYDGFRAPGQHFEILCRLLQWQADAVNVSLSWQSTVWLIPLFVGFHCFSKSGQCGFHLHAEYVACW
jgi:hypothetical protein